MCREAVGAQALDSSLWRELSPSFGVKPHPRGRFSGGNNNPKQEGGDVATYGFEGDSMVLQGSLLARAEVQKRVH